MRTFLKLASRQALALIVIAIVAGTLIVAFGAAGGRNAASATETTTARVTITPYSNQLTDLAPQVGILAVVPSESGDASPTSTPSPTPVRMLPTKVVTELPTDAPDETPDNPCFGTPAVPSLTMWSAASFQSERLGYLDPGDTFQIYSAYYGPGGPLDYFYEIGYQGGVAWTPAEYVELSGDCSSIPPLPNLVTLAANQTAAPTPMMPELSPQVFQFTMPGDIGAQREFYHIADGSQAAATMHEIYFLVHGIPSGDTNDSRRIVDFTLTCEGDNAAELRWGWADDPLERGCGSEFRAEGLTWDANTVYFRISVPSFVAYSFQVVVSAYP